ncbi:MAG: type VI secretion system protein TssA [Terriglobia bacterium]
MPLPDNLLNPIPGENPSGEDLRYAPIYDQIKEARREEEEIAQGDWVHDVKKADYPLVVKLATEVIATQSKDLQIAAWLTDALIRTEGFAGLKQGLQLLYDLTTTFWDTVYPQLEDGDAELRASPLQWVGTSIGFPLRSVALDRAGHGWVDYTESRKIPTEEQADSDEKVTARRKALSDGKLAPEVFDKSFGETPKADYKAAEAALDESAKIVETFDSLCRDKFGDAAPGFTDLKRTLQEVRHTVHLLLQKKRETDPDPVEAQPEGTGGEATAEAGGGPAEAGARALTGPVGIVIPFGDKEPAERRDAITAVARAAAALRKLDPFSPAPFLMMRGLRWGELRAALSKQDSTLLEGPPTELRQHIKRLAIEGKWSELLETTENSMSLPCSRGWLDLQKFTVDACAGLGSEYAGVALAIRSELKTLVRDVPQVLEVSLLDDTPAANGETRAWLQELAAETPIPVPDGAPVEETAPTAGAPVIENHSAPGWHRRFVDSYELAKEALKAGQTEKAIAAMMDEVERQLTGRGQFFRKLQLAEICMAAGRTEVAQPIIEDLAASIENNHLETWENPKTIAKALVMIIKNSQRVQADDSEKLRLFHKVVRLDPVQAITSLGS